MVLNYIWIAFFLIAFVVALGKLIFAGDTVVFTDIINATFDSAKSGFEISLGLTGILSLWLGIMKIGEKGGVIQSFARLAAPVFSKLFPDIPKGHPATGSIFMNFSANLLGLDNAATPMGLKAMQQLQEFNTDKESASNPMIMFLCINASGLTLIPITIMMYRAQLGAANPSDVFLPIMLATFTSTLIAILAVCIKQRINIFQKNLLLFFGGVAAFIGGLVWLFNSLEQEQVSLYSTVFANTLLFTIICGFIVSAYAKDQCLRYIYRRGQRGLQDSHNNHSIPDSSTGSHRRIPCIGCNGFCDRRYPDRSRGGRAECRFCRRVANHTDEAVEW